MPEKLVWPPKKEDLERLYRVEKLSAAKIAVVYGLKYKNPKVAESTVLYQLKRNGINRRDRAEHIRKVTDAMVDDWVRSYQVGESLKVIAAGSVDPVTVWNHLKARGLILRDRVEAQIKAVTKYQRNPFSGDNLEKAYLVGLRYGDLNAVRHGRAIRLRVSTTHPAMADLFEALFEPYGHVARYPRVAKLVGFEWNLECDLDQSFRFLFVKPTIDEVNDLSPGETIAFLAGLFDAEGSVMLHKKSGGRHNPEIAYSNSSKELLEFLMDRLRLFGFSPHMSWRKQNEDRAGITGVSMTGRVIVWRIEEVGRFLRQIGVRHREKVAKAELVHALLASKESESKASILGRWKLLISSIRSEREEFLSLAASIISEHQSLRKQRLETNTLNQGVFGQKGSE